MRFDINIWAYKCSGNGTHVSLLYSESIAFVYSLEKTSKKKKKQDMKPHIDKQKTRLRPI